MPKDTPMGWSRLRSHAIHLSHPLERGSQDQSERAGRKNDTEALSREIILSDPYRTGVKEEASQRSRTVSGSARKTNESIRQVSNSNANCAHFA